MSMKNLARNQSHYKMPGICFNDHIATIINSKFLNTYVETLYLSRIFEINKIEIKKIKDNFGYLIMI